MGRTIEFNARIYQKLPQITLGFHGCDQEVAEKVLNNPNEHLTESTNGYDWLGDGIYFWLNDPQRAYEWAVEKHRQNPKKVKDPYVIGAVIDLGYCLNLCEREAILLLQASYENLKKASAAIGLDINERYQNKGLDEGGFVLRRPLDCAVIRNLDKMMADEKDAMNFDSVYGYFQEGKDAFKGAGIREKSHIQICVRNTSCIKGYFLPRNK